MAVPWLVLRPQPEADALVAALRKRGVSALATPAIERIAAPLPRAVEDAISTARGAAHAVVVMLTSAHAAQLVAEHPALRARTFAALAPTTADAARALGLTATITSDGGLIELARAVAAWAAQHGARPLVLHPTSDAGLAREDAAEVDAALAPVADLLRFSLYQTRAHAALASTLRDLGVDRARYVATSPSTVEALRAVPHPRADAALCRGRSTAEAWTKHLADECAPTLLERDASLEDAIVSADAQYHASTPSPARS